MAALQSGVAVPEPWYYACWLIGVAHWDTLMEGGWEPAGVLLKKDCMCHLSNILFLKSNNQVDVLDAVGVINSGGATALHCIKDLKSCQGTKAV